MPKYPARIGPNKRLENYRAQNALNPANPDPNKLTAKQRRRFLKHQHINPSNIISSSNGNGNDV